MGELTSSEKAVIEIFKSAGFSGKIFPSEDACIKYLMETRAKLGINCPGYKHRIDEEPCLWHRGSGDPVCRGCDPMKFKVKESKYAS